MTNYRTEKVPLAEQVFSVHPCDDFVAAYHALCGGAIKASEELLNDNDLNTLQEFRSDILSDLLEDMPISQESPQDLTELNDFIVNQVMRLALPQNRERDPWFRVIAMNIAIMMLRHQQKLYQASTRYQDQNEGVRNYEKTLRQAREWAETENPDGRYKPIFQQAGVGKDTNFLAFLKMLDEVGSTVELVIVNDLDDNMTPNSSVYDRGKPGNWPTDPLVDSYDSYDAQGPGFDLAKMRLPIMDGAQLHPFTQGIATELLRRVGLHAYASRFRDVDEAAQLCAQLGCDFHILTGNMHLIAESFADFLKAQSGLKEISVSGLKPDNALSGEKSLYLFDQWHPKRIVIVSDDGDGSLCKAISEEEGTLPFHNFCFMATRKNVKGELPFKLQSVFEEAGIPYAENYRDGVNGYQGVLGYLKIFKAWLRNTC